MLTTRRVDDDPNWSWTQQRSRLAGLHRARANATPDQLEDARRDLRAARLADHIAKVVDQAPPLTEAQLTRLASLLHNPRP